MYLEDLLTDILSDSEKSDKNLSNTHYFMRIFPWASIIGMQLFFVW